MLKKFLLIVTISFSVYFFSWAVVHYTGINKLDIKSEDTLPAIFLPLSIIKEGDIYLDTYYNQLTSRYPHPDDKSYVKGLTPFYLIKVNNHYLSAFPIITSILAVPVYIVPVILGFSNDWGTLIVLSHIAAALIIALSGGFLYLLLRKHTVISEKEALFILLIYYFGTVNYAMISQALWQHGALQLFIVLSTFQFLELLKSGSKLNAFLFGLFSGLAILSRPTALLPFSILLIYCMFIKRFSLKDLVSKLTYVAIGLSLCVAFFFYYNTVFYRDISNQGYSSQLSTSWQSPFPISFIGVWASPSKGILVFSPVILFSILGFYTAFRKKDWLFVSYGLIVLLHTVVISLWKHWYGGWSFGYRMSSDIIPFLALLLIPVFQYGLVKKYYKLFIVTLILSVLVQIYGIVFYDGIWHAAYDLGYRNTSWLWSIRDSEFLFNIRRVLVELNLLDKACPKCL